jgi:hypothetical protein
MSSRYGILKNNQPIPCTLPFPLAGVLKGGEQINTRYSPERLRQLLDCLPGPRVSVRELEIFTGNGVPAEALISAKSPPRDYFKGSAITVGAVNAFIAFDQPIESTSTTQLLAANLLPGSYSGFLTLIGSKVGAAGVSAFRRLITFQVLADGTIDSSNAAASTVGTDVEVDAGTDITLSFSTLYLAVQATGVAATTYNWTCAIDFTQVQGA